MIELGFAIFTFFVTSAWGIIAFSVSRKDDLRWRKTEFLFNQFKLLEEDLDIKEIVEILERRKEITINDLIGSNGKLLEDKKEFGIKFDKFLNFFDRLAYAKYTLKTLNKEEISNVGWYLKLIIKNENIKNYCKIYGFDDVIKLAKEF